MCARKSVSHRANKKMEGTFCVVGGDGFIGSSLVNCLLDRGFSVHATIFPTPGKEDFHYLQLLPGAHERLKLFNADLRTEGSFDSPIQGCQGVFLVASPMDIVYKDPEPYFVSKTLAEQTALSFAAENNVDIVTIGPSVVGGPFITPYIPGSVQAIVLSFRPGNEQLLMSVGRSIMSAFGTFPVVHISDVCDAHIFLTEQPTAQGRYLCSAHALSVKEVAQFLTTRYSHYKITDKLQDAVDSAVPPNAQFKSGKLTELGFNFKYGLEEIFDDCIQSYLKAGLLTTE